MKFVGSSILVSFAFVMSILSGGAWAATQSLTINSLSFTDTLATPFSLGDTLLLDTLITDGSTGPLSQSVTFTVGPGVGGAIGEAAWLVSTPNLGPRLVGVNIDILNSSNVPIFTDTNTTVTNRVATSAISGVLTPGTYKLVATGNAIRDVSFDVSVSFVPEPENVVLLVAGLLLVAFAWSRRSKS
jgi:hypothetical protein